MNDNEKVLDLLAKLSDRMNEMDKRLNGRLDSIDAKLAELDERSLRSAVLLETEVASKVQLLLEGHSHLADTLTTKERTAKTEEKVVFLESVVKSHSERIARLEKAQ